MKYKLLFLVTSFVGFALFAKANTITITTGTSWSAIVTGSGPGGLPSSSDNIIVKNTSLLIVDVATAYCSSMQLASANTAGSLSILSNCMLTVSNNISMGDLAKVGTIFMTHSNSELIVSGFTLTGNANTAKLSATNGTIDIIGSNTLPTSTVFVKFYNLNIQSGTTSLGANTTVAGNFYVASSATINASDFNLTINGSTSIDGTISDNATNSTFTFQNLTMNSGSTTSTSAITKFTVKGNLTVSGCSSMIGVGAITWAITGGFNVTAGTVNTLGGNSFAVAGTTTVDGTINWAATNINRTFKIVNLNSGGSWYSQSATGADDTYTISGMFTFNGGSIDGAITNLYKFTGGVTVNTGVTAHIKSADITVQTGATTINGTLSYDDVLGGKSFVSDVTVSATGVWNNAANEDFTISGNLNNDGTFTSGTCTYSFTGAKALNSTSGGYSFYNMDISSTRTNNTTVTCLNSLTGTGTFKQGVSSVLNIQNSSSVTGFNGTTAINTVNYNSSTAQTVQKGTYYNLNLNGNITYEVSAAITVYGSLIVNAGIINLNSTITGNATGTFYMASSTELNIGDITVATARVFPSTFITANINLQTGNIVRYNSNIAQTISVVPNYSHLELNTGNTPVTKTLGSTTLTVSGNLTVNSDVTLSVALKTVNLTGNLNGAGLVTFVASAGTINIDGAWNNTGTFTFGKGTVSFNGRSTQTIPAIDFYNLTSTLDGARVLASSGSIGVAGSFTPGTNTYTITGSTINYNGTAAQTCSAFKYYNQTISNTKGVTLTGNVDLVNTLTLAAGKITTTGFLYTLLSDASQTGRIAALASGTSIVGNITQKRYAPGGAAGWAYIGSPITNTTLADWYNNNTEIYMSGFTGVSNSSSNQGNFVSVYTYDETQPGAFGDGASYVAPTNVTNTIVNGLGYMVYLATTVSTADALTFDVSGTPKTGNASLPVTYTNNGLSGDDGWNFVANPYPSDIDWNSSNWTKTNMDNTIYIFNADINNYATFTTGVVPDSTNGGTRYIPSSQAFFVKANASGCVLSCTENVKSAHQPVFYRTAPFARDNEFRMKLTKIGSKLSDESVVKFNTEATSNFDSGMDIEKLFPSFGESVNISTICDNRKLTTNTLNNFDLNFSIPVSVSIPGDGNYSIHFSNVESLIHKYNELFQTNNLVVENINSGKTTDLNGNIDYNFDVKNGAKNVQLIIHFKSNESNSKIDKIELFNTINIRNKDKNFYAEFDLNDVTIANIDIYNLSGQVMKPTITEPIKNGIIQIDTESLESGIYVIRANAAGKLITRKIFINQ